MSFPFERFVVWGGRRDLHSHRHIHRHFFEAAQKLRIRTVWVEDEPASNDALGPGALVLAADVWSKHIELRPGASYVLHNFDGSHPLCRGLEATPQRLLRLQVWTRDAFGERWARVRSFSKDARTLFQPWGTDLLAKDFLEPVVNPGIDEAAFVGAVWSDRPGGVELGNVDAIDELARALSAHGIRLVHLTQISDEENIRAVRESRLAPAIAGAWQVEHDYLPCRVFKNVSYGQLAITNVPAFRALFEGCRLGGDTIGNLIDEALALSAADTLELVREQQRVVGSFTYRESIESIGRAFREIRA